MLGICKAYTTRVGSGPFPTELFDEIGRGLGERGHEFGTVTGRPRRCGWFDAVLVRQAVKLGGIKGLALTKLDVLDGMASLKVCTAYTLGGQLLHHLPAGMGAQAAAKPVYEELEGWQETTRGARSFAQLPGQRGQVRQAPGGAGRVPGGPALDQPRPRRHHPDARPVRRLSERSSSARRAPRLSASARPRAPPPAAGWLLAPAGRSSGRNRRRRGCRRS